MAAKPPAQTKRLHQSPCRTKKPAQPSYAGSHRGVRSDLVSDLSAIVIKLLIQATLVGPGQMTIVRTTHIVFLLIYGTKIATISTGLSAGELPVPTFGIDAMFLIIHPMIDLVYPRMILQMSGLMPGPLSKRSGRNKQRNGSSNKNFHNCRFLSYI